MGAGGSRLYIRGWICNQSHFGRLTQMRITITLSISISNSNSISISISNWVLSSTSNCLYSSSMPSLFPPVQHYHQQKKQPQIQDNGSVSFHFFRIQQNSSTFLQSIPKVRGREGARRGEHLTSICSLKFFTQPETLRLRQLFQFPLCHRGRSKLLYHHQCKSGQLTQPNHLMQIMQQTQQLNATIII